MDDVIDKIVNELKLMDLGSGPTVELKHFSPEEFVPSAKLLDGGFDGIIVSYDNCAIAIGYGEAYASDGNVARLACKRCVARAEAIGFGGGPVTPQCYRAPKLIEMRPRSEWPERPYMLLVLTTYVDEYVAAIVAIRDAVAVR